MPTQRDDELDTAPLAASEGGVWYFTPECTRFGRHRHRELEVNLVTCGSGVCCVEDELVSLRPGSALWLSPGSGHHLSQISADCHMWVIVFGDQAVERASRALPAILRMGGRSHQLAQLDRETIGTISRHAYALMRSRQAPDFAERLAGTLCYAFRECDRAAESRPGLHPAVRRACRTIEAGSDSALSLDNLAARVELSASRLTHLFTAELGLPPSHYLHHVRIQRAVGALARDSSTTLLRAAIDAGFGSYVQFFRAFRVVTGLAPSAWERQVELGIIPLRAPQQNVKSTFE